MPVCSAFVYMHAEYTSSHQHTIAVKPVIATDGHEQGVGSVAHKHACACHGRCWCLCRTSYMQPAPLTSGGRVPSTVRSLKRTSSVGAKAPCRKSLLSGLLPVISLWYSRSTLFVKTMATRLYCSYAARIVEAIASGARRASGMMAGWLAGLLVACCGYLSQNMVVTHCCVPCRKLCQQLSNNSPALEVHSCGSLACHCSNSASSGVACACSNSSALSNSCSIVSSVCRSTLRPRS